MTDSNTSNGGSPVITPTKTDTVIPLPMDRDSIRSRILKRRVQLKATVEFFGDQIELRQPTLDDILRLREAADENAAIIQTLVDYAYIPGTDIKLFEPGDSAALRQQPFGEDFVRVTEALQGLTKLDFKQGEGNLKGTQSASP